MLLFCHVSMYNVKLSKNEGVLPKSALRLMTPVWVARVTHIRQGPCLLDLVSEARGDVAEEGGHRRGVARRDVEEGCTTSSQRQTKNQSRFKC